MGERKSAQKPFIMIVSISSHHHQHSLLLWELIYGTPFTAIMLREHPLAFPTNRGFHELFTIMIAVLKLTQLRLLTAIE